MRHDKIFANLWIFYQILSFSENLTDQALGQLKVDNETLRDERSSLLQVLYKLSKVIWDKKFNLNINKLLNRFSHFRQFSDSFSSISGDQRDGEGGALQHNLLRENLRVTELRNKLSCRK